MAVKQTRKAFLKVLGAALCVCALAASCDNTMYQDLLRDGDGEGTLPGSHAPSAPGKPSVTAASNQLTVTWQAVSAAASYEVYWHTEDNSSGIPAANKRDVSELTVAVTGLTNGTEYFVWVKAKNAAGTSGFSPSARGTPAAASAAPQVPGKPSVQAGNGQLTLTWQAVEGATAYEVYRHTADNAAQAEKWAPAGDFTNPTATVTGLTNGVKYFVWVKAKNAAGTSGFSPSAQGIPAIPTGIGYTVAADGSAGTASSTKLTFTFDAPISGLTAAEISVEGSASKAQNAQVSGSGATWELPIVVSQSGTAQIAIAKEGIGRGARTVTVHKQGQNAVFIPVTRIGNVPTAATGNIALPLTGTVTPSNAANQTIVWSVKDRGTTGAAITNGNFTATARGTATVTATIVNGAAEGTNYTQDFPILVSDPVKILASIAITTQPTKTSYTVGETFIAQGMVITATYNDATTAAVTGWTTSGFTSAAAGTRTVTVSYTENDVSKTADFTVTITLQKVSTPFTSIDGGTYGAAQTVAINVRTNGVHDLQAEIWYTLNGSTPEKEGAASIRYNSGSDGITISTTTTLKAIAYKDGMSPSEVMTNVYTINAELPPLANDMTGPINGVLKVGATLTMTITTPPSNVGSSAQPIYTWCTMYNNEERPGTGVSAGNTYTIGAGDLNRYIYLKISYAGFSGYAVRMPNALVQGADNITVGFENGTIAVTKDGQRISSFALSQSGTSGDPLSVTLSASGSFTNVVWYIDGASTGTAGSTLTVNASAYTRQVHAVTFTGWRNGNYLSSDPISFTVTN